MRLIRLKDATLYKVKTTIGEDGDAFEALEKIKQYKVIMEFVQDDVVLSNLTVRDNYVASLNKVFRIGSLHNELEEYLLPKTNNNEDNISNYLLEYDGDKYNFEKVTPRYVEITWR